VSKDSPSTRVTTGTGVAIDTKHVKTEVLVENGGTVVIGGIFQQEKSDAVNKIPLLGDLPGVGVLFRSTERTDNKTELMVFITPRVITDAVAAR
jgi:type IV pilus assembly protein PilQ